MKIKELAVVILYFVLMVSADCASPDILLTEVYAAEENEKPFDTPNDLRSHLNNLSHYYAVVGRPRFGKKSYEKDSTQVKNLKNYILQKYRHRLWLLLNSNDKNLTSNRNRFILPFHTLYTE